MVYPITRLLDEVCESMADSAELAKHCKEAGIAEAMTGGFGFVVTVKIEWALYPSSAPRHEWCVLQNRAPCPVTLA